MATTANLITNGNGDEGKVPHLPTSIELVESAIAEQLAVAEASIRDAPLGPRNAGDEINRFLLCAIIRESAKQVKTTADRSGVFLPVQTIVRRLLDSYGRAAEENPGLFSGPKCNSPVLRALNEKLCKEEIAPRVNDFETPVD